jgi:tetratricopeptide (TPR) repeat protein
LGIGETDAAFPGMSYAIPPGWDQDAHALWLAGEREPAVVKVVEQLNTLNPMPRSLFAQVGYYTYLVGNYFESARFLELSVQINGPDSEIQKNLANALLKLRRYDDALAHLFAAHPQPETNADVCDLACAIYAGKGDTVNAKKFGEWALTSKDRGAKIPQGLSLIARDKRATSHEKGSDIIAFSLWGKNPRYLRGAIRNALLIGDIYPGWRMRIYIGDDVPQELLTTLNALGVDLDLRDHKGPTLQRLGWRFEVANDVNVNRFMVRDIDSAINVREAQAVHEWLQSGKSFHVMRDWWSHTDTMLAGMWGGYAGVLPDLRKAMESYRPSFVETPNIDQWFLKDQIWPLLRSDTLIHDRYFDVLGARKFPGPPLNWTGGHVGQDEIAVRRDYQDIVLSPFIEKLACLRLTK